MLGSKIRRALLAVVAFGGLLAVSGCATPEQSMTAAKRSGLDSVQAALLVPQSGLEVSVRPIDGGQGGLLGVLIAAAIDVKREESARKAAAPILEAVRGFDFRAEMQRAIDEESARQPRLPLRGGWQLETVDSPSHRRGVYDGSSASAVLFVQVDYRLESGVIHVDARAQLVPKAASLAALRPAPKDDDPLAEGNAIYLKKFSFKRQAVTADNAAAALAEGARSVASQLIADLGRDF